MDGMIYNRGEVWDEYPFISMAEVATFVRELKNILAEAVPQPPREIKVQATFDGGETGFMTADEFQERVSDMPPLAEAERIFAMSVFADEEEPAAQADETAFEVTLYMHRTWNGTEASLGVKGRKLTVVEGVRATARAALDRHANAKRLADEDAARRENAEREREGQEDAATVPIPDATVTTPAPSRLRQVVNHPWTIGIGVTAIGTVIAALIVAAIMGSN
jgi:hypothetical protein